jgi:predicted amidohydrolase YtcJ
MAEKADLVLYNANIITLDEDKPRARMLAVKDGEIIRVGENDDRRDFQGHSVNCDGKTLIPGFNDAHCHILALAATLLSVDCTPDAVSSIADIKDAIRRQAQTIPDGEWIRAVGYDEFHLTERRHPTRHDLDEAAPTHPVKLVHRSRHACVLNSLALSMVGIMNETPEPNGGMIDRDYDTGQPNGILYAMNEYIEEKIPSISAAKMERGVKLANAAYLSQGVTSLQDATVSNDIAAWKFLQGLRSGKHITPRVSMMMGLQHLADLLANGMTPHYGDDDMQLGALKVVSTETRGALHPSLDELQREVLKAHLKGYQVAMHAVEASTVTTAVEVLEHTLKKAPRTDHRHRIEHCSICTDSLLGRLKAIGALVVTQPLFIYFSGERYLSTVPVDEQPLLYRIGSFAKSGLKPAASSDSPIASVNPLLSIHAAVNRRTQSGRDFFPEERVAPEAALRMHTLSPAYASFDEETKGSISVGKLADFALLSDDPLKVTPEQIRDIKVEATIIGGEVVWRS